MSSYLTINVGTSEEELIFRFGNFGLSGRSFGMGFRNPHQAQPQGIAIAKGDARAPENSAGDADADPEMISWQRRCY